MGTITEKSVWEPEVYSLERTDFIEGGVYGVDNLPHWQLANRTTWLKNSINELSDKVGNEMQSSVDNLENQIKQLAITTTASDEDLQSKIDALIETDNSFRETFGVITDGNNTLVAATTDTSGTTKDPIKLGIESHTDRDGVDRTYFPFSNLTNGSEDSHGFLIQPGGALVLASGDAGSTIISNNAPSSGDATELNLAAANDINFYVSQENGFDKTSKYVFAEKYSIFPAWTLNLCNKELVKGTNPTTSKTISIPLCTGDGTDTTSAVRAGLVETAVDTLGEVSTCITAYKYDNDSLDSASITVFYPREGEPYTTCPNPLDSSNTNNIATTKWVNDRLARTYAVCATAGNSKNKIIDMPGFVLKTGAYLFVNFTNMNIASTPTMDVNGTGAKALYIGKPKGYLPVRPGNLMPGKTYTILYNGTYWVIISQIDETITIDTADSYMSNNFDNLTDAGEYLIYSKKDTTKNAPLNVDASWWLRVRTIYSTANSRMQVLQDARMNYVDASSAAAGAANYLVRCFDGTNWGAWEYSYSQFAN